MDPRDVVDDSSDESVKKAHRTLKEWLREELRGKPSGTPLRVAGDKWLPEADDIEAALGRKRYNPGEYSSVHTAKSELDDMLKAIRDSKSEMDTYRRAMEALKPSIDRRSGRIFTPTSGHTWVSAMVEDVEVFEFEEDTEKPVGPFTSITQVDGEPGVYPHRVRFQDAFGHWWDADQVDEDGFKNFAKWKVE
jgi:hypothetical protein